MAKLSKISGTKGEYIFWCPGCKCAHCVMTVNEGYQHPVWEFNGDMNKPTVSPSLLVRSVECPDNPEMDENGNHVLGTDGRIKGAKDTVCHSFVKDGMIQFLSDCTHELAGKTVEMVDLNDV